MTKHIIAINVHDVYFWMKTNKPYDGAWINENGFVDKPENVVYFMLSADNSSIRIPRHVNPHCHFRASKDPNFLYDWNIETDIIMNLVENDQAVIEHFIHGGETLHSELIRATGMKKLNKNVVRIAFTSGRYIFIPHSLFNYLLAEPLIEIDDHGKLRATSNLVKRKLS